MWHGFCSVDSSHSPIVVESLSDFLIELLNAGPGTVRVKAWSAKPLENREEPDFDLEMRPGNVRAVRAKFVRLEHQFDGLNDLTHAAVGWRFIELAAVHTIFPE